MRFLTLMTLSTTTMLALPAAAQQAAPATAARTAPAQTAPAQAAPAQTAPMQAPPAAGTGMTAPQAAPGTPPANAATTTIAAALPSVPNHATLLRLVTAAKLDALLAGPGPYTVFAPNDEAFSRLPAGTLDTLLKPENVASLTTILKNHIVAGAMTEDQIKAAITAGGGRATLNTLSGQPLTATLENGSILLTDAVNNKSYVSKGDLRQANGIIHSTNGISLPKLG